MMSDTDQDKEALPFPLVVVELEMYLNGGTV
jgi:hypothetical protein